MDGDAVPDHPDDTILDLRGIRCPHVVLRAKRALRDVPIGGTLVLECTDPLAAIDVPHFINQTGHLLTEQDIRDTLLVFRIEKQR
jgi:tRNA 2-thiouridine synthesizing protein A